MKKDIKQLVTINPEKEIATTTSLFIAEQFGKRHDRVLRSIRNLIKDCKESNIAIPFFGECSYKKNGRIFPFFEVDKDFFMLLVMGFTGKEALKIKTDYINLFNKMLNRLKQIDKERHAVDWMQDRIDGKIQRRKLTDKLLPFVLYAEDQGHFGTARHTYSNFTRLVNKYAGINSFERDLLSSEMLRRVGFLENVIESKVNELMVKDMDAKTIYLVCKETMKSISLLVPYNGTTYLPTNNLLIENK